MNRIMGYIRFIYVAYAVLWFSLKGYLGIILGNRERFYRKRMGPSGRKIMKRVHSTLEIRGLENLKKDENYVLVGNHRSYTDILVLLLAMSASDRDVIFMAKKEVFSIPLLGSAVKAIGTIGVERGDSSKAMRSMIEAVKSVKNGRNLVLFPEGTRSKDGKLQPFKRGGFIIASRAQVKVAPFVLKNTEIFMPKGSFAIFSANVTLEFLPVIDTVGQKDTDVLAKAFAAIGGKL